MPTFRQYQQTTELESTDAFLISRVGVGTLYIEPVNFSMILAYLADMPSYYDDANAAANGVSVGQLYRNGSVVQIRVT